MTKSQQDSHKKGVFHITIIHNNTVGSFHHDNIQHLDFQYFSTWSYRF